MRPTRLVVEGFTAFREITEVDFQGADLFALTGPTGSGKSSVIDAMVFALYGCVPRLDRKAVEPIISLGRSEARVVLDFTVAGIAYTAARVVRRTKSGATTKEARLESGGEVLAGSAKELTEAVTALLGLTIDHFTTCVVLPQGEFMRLLHAGPSERQDLLISLLELGLYERMARVAKGREQLARQEADLARALLDKVTFATPEALSAASARVAALQAASGQVDAAVPELDRLQDVEADSKRELAAAMTEIRLLEAVRPPMGLEEHAGSLADSRTSLRVAEAEAERVLADADRAEEALTVHPPRAELEHAQRAHADRASHLAQQAKGMPLLAGQDAAVQAAEAELVAAESAAVVAAETVERAQWEHRAHDLAGSLVSGEPCPVCQHQVGSVPAPTTPGDLDQARAARQSADAALTAARNATEQARRERDRLAHKVESIAHQLAELDQHVAGHPDERTLDGAVAARTEAEAIERSARDLAGRAQKAAVMARKAVQAEEARDGDARRGFDQIRDRLGALEPPAAGHEDLAADWAALAEWAAAEVPARKARADAASSASQAAIGARTDLERSVTLALAAHGVSARSGGDLHGPVAAALATATGEANRISQGIEEGVAQRLALKTATREADLAKELHRLLNANHFEKWVLDEALAVLVAGATGLLLDLSAGAYSLALDERANFLVVDHRNADEVRPARTLSGGETFLASLALALGLADQIGALAAGGSARLESIFLDEGFGTLDPDTLDTVASAIEELGARGRMVGIISHVPELAERVPVRFEVTRDPAGSTIEKVLA